MPPSYVGLGVQEKFANVRVPEVASFMQGRVAVGALGINVSACDLGFRV